MYFKIYSTLQEHIEVCFFFTGEHNMYFWCIFELSRAFNYEFRPSLVCKHLPWVGDGDNADVTRNVNCDLYEMKGDSKCFSVDFESISLED